MTQRCYASLLVRVGNTLFESYRIPRRFHHRPETVFPRSGIEEGKGYVAVRFQLNALQQAGLEEWQVPLGLFRRGILNIELHLDE